MCSSQGLSQKLGFFLVVQKKNLLCPISMKRWHKTKKLTPKKLFNRLQSLFRRTHDYETSIFGYFKVVQVWPKFGLNSKFIEISIEFEIPDRWAVVDLWPIQNDFIDNNHIDHRCRCPLMLLMLLSHQERTIINGNTQNVILNRKKKYE